MLGLDKYASREIAYKRENAKELNKTFTQLIILRLTMLILITSIYLIFSFVSEYKIYLLIQTIYVIGYLLDISWAYNGLEEFKTTALRSIIVKLINIVAIFVFVKVPLDLCKYIAINAILVFLGNIILYPNIKKYLRLEKVSVKDVIKHIPMTLKLFIPQIAIQLYLQLGKIMIEAITGDATQVAYYDQADRIVKLPLALITALSTVMLPRISNEFKKNNQEKVKEYINKSLEFVFFLGMPIMFGLIGVSDTLVPWLLGEEFIPVIITIQLLSPIVVALCITNVIGDQYLMAVNNTKVLTMSYIVGVIMNFIINCILIPKYSYIGAAIAMVITELCIITIQIAKTRNIINIKIISKKVFKYIIASISMLLIVKLIKNINISIILITFVQVFVGVGIYGIILLILKDEFLLYLTSKIKAILGKDKR